MPVGPAPRWSCGLDVRRSAGARWTGNRSGNGCGSSRLASSRASWCSPRSWSAAVSFGTCVPFPARSASRRRWGEQRPPSRPHRPGVAPSPSPGVVVVDVAGWVRSPGVYELPVGSRVVDALQRAGGARPGADLTSINLAALLTDGEQVVIGKRGSTVGSGSSVSGSGGASGAGGGLVNINTGSLEELGHCRGSAPRSGNASSTTASSMGRFRRWTTC